MKLAARHRAVPLDHNSVDDVPYVPRRCAARASQRRQPRDEAPADESITMTHGMHPYRDRAAGPGDAHVDVGHEEALLYGLLAVVGAVAILPAVASGGVLGAQATLGLVMVIVGMAGLLRAFRRWRSVGSRADEGSRRDAGRSVSG